MESRIVSLLTANTAVTNIVSDRIYPLVIPDLGTKPAVVYTRISESKPKLYDGVSSLRKVKLQLDCWSTTFAEARALASAVESVLDEYSGTVNTMKFLSITKENQIDKLETTNNDFGVTIDFTINYIK